MGDSHTSSVDSHQHHALLTLTILIERADPKSNANESSQADHADRTAWAHHAYHACFAALRQIRSVRRSLSRDALLTVLRALVVGRVDYCNSVLAGISGILLQRLQSVMNAAARLVFSARRYEHTTLCTHPWTWLAAARRESSFGCVFSYTAVSVVQRRLILLSLSANPTMLSNFDDSGLLRRRHWLCRQRDASHSVTVPSRWQLHAPGMPCHCLSGLLHRWRCSAGIWRQPCSRHHKAVKTDSVICRSWLFNL